MITKRQSALQVLTAHGWKYVFCISRNCPAGGIITTADRAKALDARLDLDWFRANKANDIFRSDQEA